MLLLPAVVALALAGCGQTPPSPQDPPAGTPDATSSASSSFHSLTMEDVAKHATADDCYTIVDGKVYDLTGFSTKHVGGEKPIVAVCGKDGTDAFKAKHGMNLKAVQTLAEMRIGTLQK